MSQKTIGELETQELKAAAWDIAAAIEGMSGRLNAVRGELAKREVVEQSAAPGNGAAAENSDAPQVPAG